MTARRTLLACTLLLALLASGRAEASFINYSAKEINIKIVYVGPNAEANAATVRYLHGKAAPDARGKLIELTTESGKVLFFDFVPKGLGTIRGFKVRFHLYTIDGPQAPATRRLLLKGADAAVFVADARPTATKANEEAVDEFTKDLAAHGYELSAFSVVVQLDASGTKGPIDEAKFKTDSRLGGRRIIAADSKSGRGVFSALKAVAKLTLLALKKDAASAPQ